MQTQQTQQTVTAVAATPAIAQGSVTPMPTPATPNTYYITRGNKAVAQHSGNDLHKAVTLVLQLLPLTQPTPCYTASYACNTLTPQEAAQVQQLLLQACHILETANVTPAHLCKVNVTPAATPAKVQVYSTPMHPYLASLVG